MPDSLPGYLPGAGLQVVGPVAGALLATQSVGALLLHVPLAAQIGDTLLVGPFHAGVVHRSFGFQAGNPLDELLVKISVANMCVPNSLQGYLPGAGLHVVGPVAGALLVT